MTVRKKTEDIEKLILSEHASLSVNTKGRQRPSVECDELRTSYQRDRDRIIHSNAFRRLKQKTQVFFSPEGDLYRTRLTHTLEVAQIARTISRGLRLNEDLTEAIALGHDLGHTPFGHTGERILDKLSPHGFQHNVQSLRVVDVLENEGDGLNLTWEVRNGIVTHTGERWPNTQEGYIVRLSDQIAYVNHDIEDAVRAGVLSEKNLPCESIEILGDTKSKRITTMVSTIINNSGSEIIVPERERIAFANLRSYMYENVYWDKSTKHSEQNVEKLLENLYEHFISSPELMPSFYIDISRREGVERGVCDYISGMSDEFAIKTFENMFIPKRWHIL